jgi:hypothetical protein
MKPKYWKYTFDILKDKVIVKRHIVQGNNINFLKPITKPELVEELPVSIPLEEYEAFKEWTDWGAFSVSEKFGRYSLGMKKRLNQEIVYKLREELKNKYPLIPIN